MANIADRFKQMDQNPLIIFVVVVLLWALVTAYTNEMVGWALAIVILVIFIQKKFYPDFQWRSIWERN